VKLLKTVRADPSDTFVFDKAAEPGEWAISGALMFAQLDPATLTGKARAAFRSGFLGIGSFGWSTLARIVEATEEDRAAAVEQLAAHLVERFGAPDLVTARAAAEEEIAFAASLCDHPTGMLVAVSRRHENDVTHEAFRTLQTNGRPKPAPVFTFVNVVDEEEAPAERIDLTALANGERR
jgi:Zn-dependent alcohol dehydrogenase